MKWLMEFNELYNVNCEVLYFVLRLFPFKSFYEENGFLCLSVQYFINLDKDNCYNVD